MPGYDRAVTIFSPDGRLLQVEYAQEAVQKGSTAVGVLGGNCIVLGAEKKSTNVLQDERPLRKICKLDEHIAMAFAGLIADARVITKRAQIECQSHRLNLEDTVTVEYITRYIAGLNQKYTQSNGRRPFGLSCLIGGFNADGTAHLFKTEPSGTFYGWKANVTGRSSKTVLEFLEKNYRDEDVATEYGAVKLAVRALLEVVQTDQSNLDIAVLMKDQPIKMLDYNTTLKYVTIVEKERVEELEKKQQKK